jgi:hypothetical protein
MTDRLVLALVLIHRVEAIIRYGDADLVLLQ